MNSSFSQYLKVLLEEVLVFWLKFSGSMPPDFVFESFKTYSVIINVKFCHYPKHGRVVITEEDKVRIERKF